MFEKVAAALLKVASLELPRGCRYYFLSLQILCAAILMLLCPLSFAPWQQRVMKFRLLRPLYVAAADRRCQVRASARCRHYFLYGA